MYDLTSVWWRVAARRIKDLHIRAWLLPYMAARRIKDLHIRAWYKLNNLNMIELIVSELYLEQSLHLGSTVSVK